MSKLDYPFWSYGIVLAAIVLPPGFGGIDLALLIFRGSFAAMLTLLALLRFEASSGLDEKMRQVRRGAWSGTALVLLFAILLGWAAKEWLPEARTGWVAIASSSIVLSFGLRLHSSERTAAWRHQVSMSAANDQEDTAGRSFFRHSLLPLLAAGVILRDGLEAALYIPALMLSLNSVSLGIGVLLGLLLVGFGRTVLPRLSGQRPLRRLSCLMPALTLFLGLRLFGLGVIMLQQAGLMRETPFPYWPYPATWEWLLSQLGLLLAMSLAAHRFRKHSNAFIHQINL
ncbi:hypothetical protein [Gorillibacterium sp. CAU 1737]|uniref:hypothetical protein n=1 Tax=Gorillibacterium sp. CAU 1737 TaxID=3140362 RepID=UPI0032604EAC